MATVTTLTTNIWTSMVVALINSNGNLYTHGPSNLIRIHPTTGAVFSITVNGGIGGNMPYSLGTYKTRIYATNGSIVYYDISGGTRTTTGISSYLRGACVLDNFLYYNNGGILKRMNLDTHTEDSSWQMNMSAFNSAVGYAGYIYGGISSGAGIYKISVANMNYTMFLNSVTPNVPNIYGLEIHNNSLYVSLQGASQINRYDLDDPTDNTIPFAMVYGLGGGPCGITAFNNKLYALGYASTYVVSMDLPTYTIPANITLDDVNTYNVASGNVQVSINDITNVSTNNVSYWYSTTGGVPNINSGVKNNGPSQTNYRFYIPLSIGMYTISVYAKNKVGNTSIVSKNITVNTTPVAPSIDTGNTISRSSGNLTVSIIDLSNSATNGIYYLYSTDGITYGNSGVPTTSGITRYTFTINNTGNALVPLVANTYTLRVRASNPVGNATSTSFSVPVYTTPVSPFIDTGNTVPTSIGNLQVSIIDPSNVSTNGITYWYSTNGNIYINSNIANNGPSQTRYTFTIPGLSSSVNTIYVYAKNSVGNSAPISTPVNITGAPGLITSYSTDFSLENGITVSILDTNNRASNNIYYYYYTVRTGDTSPNQSGNILVYSNSYVSLTSGSSVSSFHIPNLMKGDYTVYVAAVNSYGSSIYTPAITPISVICFKEDSRILTNKGYKKIQHLKKGDLVKTLKHGFKPIYKIGKKEIVHMPTEERSKNHLYKCSPAQYPELFEDLVLTGCHSILVDGYVNEEQVAKSIEVNGRIYLTEGKYRVPVCADLQSSIYEKAGKYMVYHIALENDDYYMNYGIYANGLLVESTSKRFLEEMNIMETYQ